MVFEKKIERLTDVAGQAIKETRIPALTGLRFLAAMFVLIPHATVKLTSIKLAWALLTGWAAIGMTVFFVLSGFVMWINYAPLFKRGNLGPVLWKFGVARFARLYPLYLLILLLGIVIFPREGLKDALPALATYFIAIQSLIPAYGDHILAFVSTSIGHTWSISVEMIFYVFFPLLVLLFFKLKSPSRILWVLGLVFLLHVLYFYLSDFFIRFIGGSVAPALSIAERTQWILNISPFRYMTDFIAGCLTALLFEKFPPVNKSRKYNVWFYISLGMILLSKAVYAYGYYHPLNMNLIEIFERSIPLFALCYILFYLASFPSAARTMLSLPWIVLGGEISYSIYLLHPLVLELFPQEIISEHSVAMVLLLLLSYIMVFIVTLFFAYGTYRAVEVPCRIWLRHKLSEKASARPLVAAIAIPILAITIASILSYSPYPHHATRMKDLQSIRSAFEAYRRDHGSYPLSRNSQGAIDWIGLGWGGVDEKWLADLVPAYLAKAPRDPRMTDIAHAQYIWNSDGKNYKIISMQPEDCAYTIKQDPSLSDARRNTAENCMSYGYWTPGAANW